jgi:hypothetical protein
MGEQLAGQSLYRSVSVGETRKGYQVSIDPIALGLDCPACVDLHSLVDLALCFFRVQMSGFHDLLRQKPTILFILVRWSSILMASLTMWSMYWVLVARTEVLWNWIRCPQSTLCSDMADLSGCSRQMCRWCSFNLASTERPVCQCRLCTLTGDSVYIWCPKFQVIFDQPEETRYFLGRQAHWFDVVLGQHSAEAVEYSPDIG